VKTTPIKSMPRMKNLFEVTKECLSENVTLNPIMMTPIVPVEEKPTLTASKDAPNPFAAKDAPNPFAVIKSSPVIVLPPTKLTGPF